MCFHPFNYNDYMMSYIFHFPHEQFPRIDLSVGQASLAKASVLERTPYWGLALSERHARKVEVVLTDFVLSEMKKRGLRTTDQNV